MDIQNHFDDIKGKDNRLSKVHLVISDDEKADAHMNGKTMTISSKHNSRSDAEIRYLISHEFGHYLRWHDQIFYLAFIAAVILGAVSIYIAEHLFALESDSLYSLGIPLLTVVYFGIFIYIKSRTLYFEYQADAAGYRLLQAHYAGEYKRGLVRLYQRRKKTVTDQAEKDIYKERALKKFYKLPRKIRKAT